MYDIRHFRPTFYLVLILAFAGYSIALESPPHLIGGLLLIALHALLIIRGSRFLLPRPLASTLAVVTGLWGFAGLIRATSNPLLAISQWLFMLVLIILYSRRENRAYGQMLVMSLVLMVAGAINTANVIFGAILIVYLFLALYCCLLFHLKVETEYATRAYNITDRRYPPGSLRHDQRYFNRSMRRLTILVSTVAILSGVAVFLLFPRSRLAPALAMAAQGARSSPLTGFSERMGFEQVARITQNEEVVAHVSLAENGQPLPPSEIYLRGVTLDIYTGNTNISRQHNWQWIRSAESGAAEPYHLARSAWQPLSSSPAARQIRQTILLQPTGTSTLFALSGVCSISTDAALDVQHSPVDGTLRTIEVLRAPIRYEAISTGEPPPFELPRPPARIPLPPGIAYRLADRFASMNPTTSRIDPQIVQYALRPEVSGTDADGPFADRRAKDAPAPTPLDEKIATAISHHLQSQFKYTLDLSDVNRRPLHDPIVQFLYDFRRGHCEYFAGAMTLMCQSLGLKARVVVGFRAGPGDYNRVGGYYVIRQSHAHAWVEVLTPEGWKSFDPTAADSFVALQSRGMFAPLADFFDYLQYKWATSVVTYDNQGLSVLGNVESGITQSLEAGNNWFESIGQYFRSAKGYEFSNRILAAATLISIAGMLLAIVIYVTKRRRLNRRAQRIGLGALPSQDRLRLARQLRFYDDLLQLLARQRIGRPPHLTPREFASTLDFLPSEVYGKIGHVTEVFYRVRYGDAPLATHEHREINAAITEIAAGLRSSSQRIGRLTRAGADGGEGSP